MLKILLLAGTSLLFLGSAVSLFWHTCWRGTRSPTETFQFFVGMAVLSCTALVVGSVLGYPLWFRAGASIMTGMMFIQTVQLYAFRHFLRNASDESVRLATFMHLNRQGGIFDQANDSRERQLKPAQSSGVNPHEVVDSEL